MGANAYSNRVALETFEAQPPRPFGAFREHRTSLAVIAVEHVLDI